jgi:replicative DNA helicase Mcm
VEIIEPDMFQKYIAYAKKNIHPTLSDAAREKVVDYYVQLRTKGGGINAPNSQYTDGKNSGMEEIGGKNQHGSLTSVPISPRAIESLVRMAEAYARTRLRDEVIIEDAELAIATLDTWRYELMGKDYDETSIVSGKTTTKRNREHHIVSFIIQQYQETDQTVELFSILNEMEKHSISKSQVEAILDSLCNGGTLFRPLSNRDGYQPT